MLFEILRSILIIEKSEYLSCSIEVCYQFFIRRMVENERLLHVAGLMGMVSTSLRSLNKFG